MVQDFFKGERLKQNLKYYTVTTKSNKIMKTVASPANSACLDYGNLPFLSQRCVRNNGSKLRLR